MNLTDLESRLERLDQLSRGLAKEEIIMKQGNDPLLYRERQDYLAAIRAALSGVEGARPKYVGVSDSKRARAQGASTVTGRSAFRPQRGGPAIWCTIRRGT
jgi:hypothetical protein